MRSFLLVMVAAACSGASRPVASVQPQWPEMSISVHASRDADVCRETSDELRQLALAKAVARDLSAETSLLWPPAVREKVVLYAIGVSSPLGGAPGTLAVRLRMGVQCGQVHLSGSRGGITYRVDLRRGAFHLTVLAMHVQ